VVAGWTWVRPGITLSPRISAALFGPAWLVTTDLRATRTWDLGRLSIDLGFTAGGGMMYWRDEFYELFGLTVEQHPDKPVVHVDATVGASLLLGGRTYLGAELAAQTHFVLDGFGSNPALVTVNLLYGIWL
jgi:hypothetical protein